MDWCGCSPNVFKLEDWKKILSSKNRDVFFARKFDPTISQIVMDKIDGMVFGTDGANVTVEPKYWENIYHILDDQKEGDIYDMTLVLADQCANFNSISNYELIEVNAFYENDELKSALIVLNITSLTENNLFECKFELPRPVFIPESIEIMVNSKFDVKERVFRNPLSVISPKEGPQVLIKTKSKENVLVNLLWISPNKDVVHASRNILVNASKGMYHFFHILGRETKNV